MIPRFGEPRQRQRSYRYRKGSYAVLISGGAVLLTHQAAPVPEYQLPGGGVDAGESALHALHREVREETGWRIAPLYRLGAFRRFTYMPEYDEWAEKLCAIYLARPVRPLGAPREAGHSAVWMPLETAVARLADDGNRHFLWRAARQPGASAGPSNSTSTAEISSRKSVLRA